MGQIIARGTTLFRLSHWLSVTILIICANGASRKFSFCGSQATFSALVSGKICSLRSFLSGSRRAYSSCSMPDMQFSIGYSLASRRATVKYAGHCDGARQPHLSVRRGFCGEKDRSGRSLAFSPQKELAACSQAASGGDVTCI